MTEEELKEQVYSMSNEDFAQKIAAMNTVSDSSLDNSVSTQSVEPEPKTDDKNVDDTTQNNSNESNADDDDGVIDDNNPFGESKSKDEPTDDSKTTEPTEPKDEPQSYKIRANGVDFELSLEDLINLAPKALDYTKKLQKIAPYRRAISALEEEGITEEELNQLIEIRKGNSVAIKNLLDKHNISTSSVTGVDENTSKEYKPQSYGKSEEELTFNETIQGLMQNPHYEKMRTYVNSLDNTSRQMLMQNPQAYENLIRDIESNVFDESIKLAKKRKLMEVGSSQPDILYYIESAQSLWDKKRAELLKQNEPKKQTIPNQEASKKNAKLSGDKSSSINNKKVVEMISDIDEEEYQAFLNRAMRPTY